MSKSTKSATSEPVAEPQTPAAPTPNVVSYDHGCYLDTHVDSVNRRAARIFQQLSIVWGVMGMEHDEEYWPDAMAGAREIVGHMRDEAYWLREVDDEVGNLPCPDDEGKDAIKDGDRICVVTKRRDGAR